MNYVLKSLAFLIWAAVMVFMVTFAGRVLAAPFVISDPWPAGIQPDACTAYEEPGPTTRDLTLEATQTGLKYIHADLANGVPGFHSWKVVCTAEGYLPSIPVTFDFTIPPVACPCAPTNLRFVP